METALYLSKEKLQLVRGVAGRNRLTVEDCLSLPLPSKAPDEAFAAEELTDLLSALYRQKRIGKSCKLSVDCGQILAKVMEVPFLKPKEIRVAVRRELEDLESGNGELVFDYAVLEGRLPGLNRGRILGSAMPVASLAPLLQAFAAAGLRLKSCETELNSLIKAVRLVLPDRRGPFVLATANGALMTALLFDEGKYLFTNRSQLVSPPGTDEYAAEITGKISAIKQFHKGEKSAADLEHVFVYGLAAEEVKRCRNMTAILGIDLAEVPNGPHLLCHKGEDGGPFQAKDHLCAVGCLYETK